MEVHKCTVPFARIDDTSERNDEPLIKQPVSAKYLLSVDYPKQQLWHSTNNRPDEMGSLEHGTGLFRFYKFDILIALVVGESVAILANGKDCLALNRVSRYAA